MTMRLTDALDDVLASRGHLRVLRALDALPDGLGVSARDLARRSAVAHNRASEVLSGLTHLGLARVQRAGRADLYQFNRQHVLYPAVHELFDQETKVQEDVQRFLRRRLSKMAHVREAYIFGSVARGESRVGSDIDLALIMPPSGPTVVEQRELDEIAREVRERFGSELGVHVSPRPLADRVEGRAGQALWRRVAAEGIRLIPATSERA
jgi:predicted nucleotidyltransferase